MQRFFLYLLVLLSFTLPVRAGMLASEAIEIDRIVQKNPRQAAAEAHLLLQQASTKNDRSMQLRALRLLANAHSLLGDMFVLGEDIPRGERLARELNNPQAWIEFVIARANDAQLAGQFAKADKQYAEALAVAQKSQLPLGLALSYAALVNAALDRGLKTNVVIYATKAYDLFESQGDVRGMALMLAALGIHSSEPARSVEYLERAADMFEGGVIRWDAAVVNYYLGAALYRNRDYPKARAYLQKALLGANQLRVPVNAAHVDYYLGRVDLAERDFNGALGHWDRAMPIFVQTNDLPAIFETQRFHADALSALGRKTESQKALEQVQIAAASVKTLELKGKSLARTNRLQGPLTEYQLAYQEMLGNPDQKRAEVPAYMTANVAEAKFDAKLRETENALLKEQQKRTSLERVIFVLALLGCIAVLMLGIFVLIRQIRQKRQFANLAARGELTGLRNRRSILEFARVQFGMRLTLGTRLFVAIIDLDHFKAANDQYGHDVGDAVLIGFASALHRHLRSNHVFSRFGGEEFMLIMPDTREDQVFDIFERLREIVGEMPISGVPASHRLSFSMGGAEARADTGTIETLIKAADLALYRAKEKGRDRCEIFEGGLQATYDSNVRRTWPRTDGVRTHAAHPGDQGCCKKSFSRLSARVETRLAQLAAGAFLPHYKPVRFRSADNVSVRSFGRHWLIAHPCAAGEIRE